ncbi:MAG: class F sortase [Candidatus Taylorbacteria bacterium]|nr:class F sortase [Candidatus Taylorbacteria bacterium]
MSTSTKKKWWRSSKSRTAIFSFGAALFIILLGFTSVYVERSLKKRAELATPTGIPVKLLIPSIGVKAIIEKVGVDSQGRMGLPSNFTDVGWYTYGPHPGEKGSAVIAGHLDTATDANAVFGNLANLKKGDDVYVIDDLKQIIHFKMLSTETYDEAEAPLEKIFNQRGGTARLNLVTCDGVWNQETRNYSERRVVYLERAP